MGDRDTPSVQLPYRASQQPPDSLCKIRASPGQLMSQAVSVRPKCYNKPWRQDSGPLRIQRIDSAEKRASMYQCEKQYTNIQSSRYCQAFMYYFNVLLVIILN